MQHFTITVGWPLTIVAVFLIAVAIPGAVAWLAYEVRLMIRLVRWLERQPAPTVVRRERW